MLRVKVIAIVCLLTELGAYVSLPLMRPVHAQGVTAQIHPSDEPTVTDLMYPDAVACDVRSPDQVGYKIIFYKSQITSFGNQPNNVAEYGTTFVRDPDKFDSSTPYKWRLQLGQPGKITLFTLPPQWQTENCAVGKSIADLVKNKQALRIFAPQ
jgi:hypothetical protein